MFAFIIELVAENRRMDAMDTRGLDLGAPRRTAWRRFCGLVVECSNCYAILGVQCLVMIEALSLFAFAIGPSLMANAVAVAVIYFLIAILQA